MGQKTLHYTPTKSSEYRLIRRLVSEMLKCNNQESGQAIMEFILSMMVSLSFFFFFMKLSLLFAVGNYFHYATFMGARAYLSSDLSEEEQKANAEAVLKKMIGKRWSAIAKRENGSGNSETPGVGIGPGPYFLEHGQPVGNPFHWNQGVSFAFNSDLSLFPWSRSGKGVSMKLTSESWLGREESLVECEATKGEISKQVRQSVKGSKGSEWDNGNGC